jgi:hypothetical protein
MRLWDLVFGTPVGELITGHAKLETSVAFDLPESDTGPGHRQRAVQARGRLPTLAEGIIGIAQYPLSQSVAADHLAAAQQRRRRHDPRPGEPKPPTEYRPAAHRATSSAHGPATTKPSGSQ